MTLTLTQNEVAVLKLLLSVDMGALGLDSKDIPKVRSILKKLNHPTNG